MLSSSALLSRLSSPSPFRRTIWLSKMSTTPRPLIPKFVPVEQSETTSISKPDGSVLYHTTFWLRWKARSQAILTVLKNLNTDFLCLQEVDEYDSLYKRNMEGLGYSSIDVQRTGQKRDGCGIFYKNNRHDQKSLEWMSKSGQRKLFELVLEETIDYNDLVNSVVNTPTPAAAKECGSRPGGHGDSVLKNVPDSVPQNAQGNRGDPNDPRVRLKRDCVGVMAVFKLKDPSCHHIIVANTHLYWDPEWADVKLAQAKYLLSRIDQFKALVSSKLDYTPSVIVAGDFNSVPGDQVYQYLVSGTSTGHLPESDDELPLPLNSVYAYTRGEPHFTNCTPGCTATLDYILFYPSGNLKPVSYLQLPESESPDVIGELPNHFHPSDHLPIGAEFELLQ